MRIKIVGKKVIKKNGFGAALLGIFLLSAVCGGEEQWNQFRGPGGDGISSAQQLPVRFSETENIRWKIQVPDSGWSSPVVWGDEVWLTTGSDDKKELRLLCIDVASGKTRKNIKVFDALPRTRFPGYRYDSPHLNSPATPTPVVEKDRVYVSFGSQGLACLDRMSGERIWERRDLRIYQPVRQGSSPIVDGKNLYVAFDGIDKQFFVALDKRDGHTVWKTDRNIETDWEATLRERGLKPKAGGGKPNDNKKAFATAKIITVDGRRQLIAPAAEATIAYDPDTGKELWRVYHPGGFNVAARPLYAHGLVYVFTSGLTGHLLAVRADGSGDVTRSHVQWTTTRGTPHIPSPVILGDRMYLVTEKGGVLRCLDARSGEETWKLRLGGDHWASPILANGKLYFSTKRGQVHVVDAGSSLPENRVTNRLNASFIASPAVAGSHLLMRSTTHLYCFAEGYSRSPEQVAADSETEMDDENEKTDWEKAYRKLLADNPAIRQKVEK
ncbi:MAG: PQQ-binding-like beta-propeller repeat protein, partial [Planctomycetota bacterium]|nr:PQQ-binding-like beta-propeller repeat protein [Planctomycetota bacterium]